MPINYINHPMMDESGKAIVDELQNIPKLQAFDPETDKGKYLTVDSATGELALGTLPD